MKVGILTFHWADNYGAVLQAHGLCQTLKRLGHEVSLIDYVPPAERLPCWRGWHLRSGRQMPLHVLRRLRYDQFRRRYLPLTRPCRTIEDMRAVSADFDAVIVGSDQVWNGHIAKTSQPYFLDFVDPQRCRRISFAASFGESGQPRGTLDAATSLLRDFSGLSVRDEMSADLVRELSGREASVVVDPALLHHYGDVMGPQGKKTNYMAVYFICPQYFSRGQDLSRATKECLRLPVLTISADGIPARSGGVTLSAGPSEWLRVLQGASFICTDSFHGAVFAVKFRKPFICWPGLRPERLASFLRTCHLQSRLLGEGDLCTARELARTAIDYDAVLEELSPHINRSLTFLVNALAS